MTPGLRELYQDEDLLLLDKPAGWHVFPARDRPHSVWTVLRERHPELAALGSAHEGSIVHRLDRETSGLLVAARSQPAYRNLRAQFTSHTIAKEYLALVEGSIHEPYEIDLPLGARYRGSRKVSVFSQDRRGKRLHGICPALTRVDPLAAGEAFSLVRITIRTGMRHQIRAHLAHSGHPIANDLLYDARPLGDRHGTRFALHAWCIHMLHPRDTRPFAFACGLANDLQVWAAELGFPKSTLARFVDDHQIA